jgi:hypothetical protein
MRVLACAAIQSSAAILGLSPQAPGGSHRERLADGQEAFAARLQLSLAEG